MPDSFQIFIDAGNQRLKWRADGVDYVEDWKAGSKLANPGWLEANSPSQALISSVRTADENQQMVDVLEEAGYQAIFAKVEARRAGLRCGYIDISQLGVDRWLAMLACWAKIQSGFVHVGAGTALTVDLVSEAGEHQGGYITAGMGLIQEALVGRSEKLRLQYREGQPSLEPALDTAGAINNGALLALVELVRGVHNQVGTAKPGLIISGGDAALLAEHLKGGLVWQNIVLDGLSVWADSVASDE